VDDAGVRVFSACRGKDKRLSDVPRSNASPPHLTRTAADRYQTRQCATKPFSGK